MGKVKCRYQDTQGGRKAHTIALLRIYYTRLFSKTTDTQSCCEPAHPVSYGGTCSPPVKLMPRRIS